MSLLQTLDSPLAQLRTLRDTVPNQVAMSEADWMTFLQALLVLVKVPGAALLLQPSGSAAPKQMRVHAGSLRQDAVERWLNAPDTQLFFRRIQGQGIWPATPLAALPQPLLVLQVPGSDSEWLLLVLTESDLERQQDLWVRLRLLLELLPGQTPAYPILPEAQTQVPASTTFMPLLGELLRAQRFQAAGYGLVNGLAAELAAVDQVALGWCSGPYMRARFISHFERFERKTETVRLIEAALEEAADQDQVISTDAESAPGVIDIAHRQLATHLGAAHLMSFPLHDAKGQGVAALLLVSLRGRIQESDQASSFFLAQTAMPQLEQLQAAEGGVFGRVGRGLRNTLGQWFGPENLWIKVLAMLFSGVLLASMVVTTEQRIAGSAQLVTDETRLMVAPWTGRVAEVFATSGETVAAGDVLLVLDAEDAMLQLAELQAEQQRIGAELARARANFDAVDVAISEARLQQIQARIAQIQRQIAQATLRAPFAGIVVEGDRRDLISAPVTQGQALMRIAEMQGLYVSIEIPEANIHHLQVGQVGELLLVAQPNTPLPIVLERIIPMARNAPETGAVFDVTARLDMAPDLGWRPGMTGVVRLDGERRSLLWLATHRAWQQLRLWLWW